MSDQHLPYPADTQWKWRHLNDDVEHVGALALDYLIHGTSFGGGLDPDEVPAIALWDRFVQGIPDDGRVPVEWHVSDGCSEFAPLHGGHEEHFLAFFTWPTHAVTGEKVNWLRLPVLDQGWTRGKTDPSGFFQQLTGWKPAPFTPYVNIRDVAALTGLPVPDRVGATPIGRSAFPQPSVRIPRDADRPA